MITSTNYEKVEQRGTLDTSTARVLTIDTEGMAAILHTLTNMYGNPALAVVREYSCNGLDSHVEAGQTRPIEVTLPTRLNPQLQIRDFGIGLTEDEILTVFANYGSSTKRHTNALIGAMGIGAKSAFTVGNDFTVTAVKDEIRTVALFSKNRDGAPTVDILVSGEQTDEGNGVLIDIGVEDIDAIRSAARKLFYTWNKGTVLVDGAIPNHVWEEKTIRPLGQVDQNSYFLNTSNHQSGYNPGEYFSFVMGGVEYELTSSVFGGLSSETQRYVTSFYSSYAKFYIIVPIGSVEITPSREDLRTTPRTLTTVENAILTLKRILPRVISQEVDKAATFTEAAKLLRTVTLALGWKNYSDMTWRGRPFEKARINLEYPHIHLANAVRNYENLIVTRLQEDTTISIDMDLDHFIFVTDVPEGKIATVRRYAKLFLEDRDSENKFKYKIVASPLHTESLFWLSYGVRGGIESIPFEDYREIGRKLMKAANSDPVKRYTTKYSVPTKGKLNVAELLDLKLPIAVFPYHPYSNDHRHTKVAEDALVNYTVVHLTRGQQMDVFLKRVPSAKLGSEIVKTFAKNFINGLSTKEKALLNNRELVRNLPYMLVNWVRENLDKITNPDVRKWAETINTANNSSMDSARVEYIKQAFSISMIAPDAEDSQTDINAFLINKLPLLYCYLHYSHILHRQLSAKEVNKAILDYVNTVVI